MTPRALLAALLFAVALPAQAATEIIQLNFRSAEDLLPTARSLLGQQGKASAYGNQLIVDAPPEKIEELRGLLGQLDTRPRRLLISVDTRAASSRDERGYRVDGSLGAGGVSVESGRGEVGGRDQARIIRHSTQSRGDGVQQVQATEGYPALIQVGQSVPITTTSTGPYGQLYQDTQYRTVTQGFYVTASLSGDTVQLDISSNRDRLSQRQPGAIDVQSTDTRLSGRLGEWLPLGGVSQASQADQRGFVQRYSTQGEDDMTLRVKVEALD